jgi:hypothetical protein
MNVTHRDDQPDAGKPWRAFPVGTLLEYETQQFTAHYIVVSVEPDDPCELLHLGSGLLVGSRFGAKPTFRRVNNVSVVTKE